MKTIHCNRAILSVMAFLCLVTVPLALCMDGADADPGESADEPWYVWNHTIVLLPMLQDDIANTDENLSHVAPDQYYIDWGDGTNQVKQSSEWTSHPDNADGYIKQGTLEVVHTYENTGLYHIQGQPQKAGYEYDVYELYVYICADPIVGFVVDGELYTSITATTGTDVSDQEHRFYTAITAPEDPVKEGYTFDGWYMGFDLYDFSQLVKNDINLVAKFTEIEVEYIDITVNGQPVTIEKGKTVADLDNTAPEGKEFAGWYSEETFENALEDSDVLTAGSSYFGKYTDLPAEPEKVTVMINGEDTEVEAGMKVSELPVVIPAGKILLGWFSDSGMTIPVNPDSEVLNGNHYFAKFTDASSVVHIVTFVKDGETYTTQNVVEGESAVKPQGTDKGHFEYYSDADFQTEYEFGAVTEDTTVYMKWVEDSDCHIIFWILIVIGAILILIGYRYHPVILFLGIVIAAIGVMDVLGLISVEQFLKDKGVEF